MRFADIVTRVKDISNVTGKDGLIKDSIQAGLNEIASNDLPYLMEEEVLLLVAPYETGTITTTNASKTITGSSTTFTSAMVGRKIRIGSETQYYRVAAFVSTTEITLNVEYQGTGASGATYSIYKDEYRMAPDADAYKVLRQMENAKSVIDLSPTAFDLFQPAPTAEGPPSFSILVGSKLDTYETGTVSGTGNASTITGSSTLWTDVEGLERGSKITVGSYVYTVKSVDSDTQLTIYENLVATISAGTAYIVHLDNLIIQFFDIPDAAELIHYRYQRRAYPLIDDQDIPDLPLEWHHILINAGLIWAWATKDKQQSALELTIFQSKKKDLLSKIGNISKNRVYSRRSQDIFFSEFPYGPLTTSDRGVPEPL